MAWLSGGPGSKIPEAIKVIVRTRQENLCNTINPAVCTGLIDEYDHVVNVKTLRIPRSQANDASNIQGLCCPCHKIKTQAEALAGRKRHLRQPLQHPGLKKD